MLAYLGLIAILPSVHSEWLILAEETGYLLVGNLKLDE